MHLKMGDVEVIPNFTLTRSDASTPTPVVSTHVDSSPRIQQGDCDTEHCESQRRRPVSRRAARTSQAVNFLLYGITLMIPGVAMIIVYFVVFRIPAGDIRWSPADAFVITGAILVGFSIVSEVIGIWQCCMSRYESDEPEPDASTTIQNPQYSDSPPSYNAIQTDLPDLVVISVSQDNDINPPSFEACVTHNRALPGLDNHGSDNKDTDDDDLPPPPDYLEAMKRKESKRGGVSAFISNNKGSVSFTTSRKDK